MQLIIDADVNQDNDTMYGWYLYGYVVKSKNVISRYDTDISLISVLNVSSVEEYRNILTENGSTTLANGRTCFPSKDIAMKVVPLLEPLINYDLIC